MLGILLAKAKQKFFRAEVLDLVTEGGGLFEIDFFGRIRAFQFPVDVVSNPAWLANSRGDSAVSLW